MVAEQAMGLITRFTNFWPTVEMLGKYKYILIMVLIDFPGEMRQNYLVLKGTVSSTVNSQTHQFPVKIIVPQGFPFHPPRVYLDMPITTDMLKSKSYLGQSNAFKFPYLTNWTTSHNAR